jgi:hypothetical protein
MLNEKEKKKAEWLQSKLREERKARQDEVRAHRRDAAALVEKEEKATTLSMDMANVAKRKSRAADASKTSEQKATEKLTASKSAEEKATRELDRSKKKRKLELQQARRSGGGRRRAQRQPGHKTAK